MAFDRAAYLACREGDLPKLKALMATETEIRVKELVNHHYDDEYERTLLHGSCFCTRPEVTEYLLELGANVDAGDADNFRPLHYVKSETQAMAMIRRGAAVNAIADGDKNETPLHQACIYGKLAVAKVLLNQGADIKALLTTKETPLHLACEWGHQDLAKILVERGADVCAWAQAYDGRRLPFDKGDFREEPLYVDIPLLLATHFSWVRSHEWTTADLDRADGAAFAIARTSVHVGVQFQILELEQSIGSAACNNTLKWAYVLDMRACTAKFMVN
eukprot:m.30869 g.30869  ORF g.30869 m.30869 type:complete len:275 (-) comp12008_c0_seq3:12-836(-)